MSPIISLCGMVRIGSIMEANGWIQLTCRSWVRETRGVQARLERHSFVLATRQLRRFLPGWQYSLLGSTESHIWVRRRWNRPAQQNIWTTFECGCQCERRVFWDLENLHPRTRSHGKCRRRMRTIIRIRPITRSLNVACSRRDLGHRGRGSLLLLLSRGPGRGEVFVLQPDIGIPLAGIATPIEVGLDVEPSLCADATYD